MAKVIVTLRIMPETPETDLAKIEAGAKKLIADFGGEVGKVDIQPIAFGLKSLNLIFIMDESLGSTEKLEENIKTLAEVNSVEITDVRRAIG